MIIFKFIVNDADIIQAQLKRRSITHNNRYAFRLEKFF